MLRPLARRLALVVLLSLGVGAGTGHAATKPALRLSGAGMAIPAGRVLTDGAGRFAVASLHDLSTTQVTVIDPSGRTPARTLPAPRPNCDAVGLRGTSLLWDCDGRGVVADPFGRARLGLVQSVLDGSVTQLPDPSPLVLDTNTDLIAFTAIGTRWVRLTTTAYHGGDDIYLDRATGAFVRAPIGDRPDLHEDLDASTPLQPSCADVRRPARHSDLGQLAPDSRLEHVDGWWLAAGPDPLAEDDDRLLLERCGRAPFDLSSGVAGAPAGWTAVLGTGFVAFITTRSEGTGDGSRATSRLVVRRLDGRRIGRPRTLPVGSSAVPYAVGARLYLLADGRLRRVALGR